MYNFIREKRDGYKINENDIRIIEDTYNIKFPSILKKYYIEHNGDLINLCEFNIDNYVYEVFEIVQLKIGECCFEYIVEEDKKEQIISEDMFPIANNQGGDYYYWDKNSENVYLYYGDDIENPIFICNDINEFFNILNNSSMS